MKTEDLHRHTCYITGKGMSDGFLFNDETYEKREDFVKVLREAIPSFNADINIGYNEGYFGDDALGGALIPKTISDEDLLEFSYDNEYHLWTEWYQDDLEDEGEGYDDDGNLYEFKNNEWVKFSIEKEDSYTLDKVCTGNHKADNINSRIMEVASDFAEMLTEKDCKLSNIVCYNEEDENGTTVLSYTEEAQDIFNEYYDVEVDRLYILVNRCIDIHES